MDLPVQGEGTTSLYCSHCEELFENTAQQRKHYKQDWHRYNLKLRLACRPAITEEKFDQLAGIYVDDNTEGKRVCNQVNCYFFNLLSGKR